MLWAYSVVSAFRHPSFLAFSDAAGTTPAPDVANASAYNASSNLTEPVVSRTGLKCSELCAIRIDSEDNISLVFKTATPLVLCHHAWCSAGLNHVFKLVLFRL